jgi:predicted nucleic acid-binding protein
MGQAPAVLDTDTLSEISRGNLRVQAWALSYLQSFGRLTITAITAFERLRGYRLALREGKPFERQLEAFEALLANCVVLPFDDAAAAVAAEIWSSASRSRRRDLGDILIAAIAVSRRLPLVTRNRRDFERLAQTAGIELHLLDWGRPRRPHSPVP